MIGRNFIFVKCSSSGSHRDSFTTKQNLEVMDVDFWRLNA